MNKKSFLTFNFCALRKILRLHQTLKKKKKRNVTDRQVSLNFSAHFTRFR